MINPEENKWYALYTKARFEKKTGKLLTELGFEVYVPLIKTLKQWSDRKKKVEEPLFRSYIFVKTIPEKFHWIRGVDGAVYIVSFNREPATIPEEQITALRILLGSEEIIDISTEDFAVGDAVEVTQGSLIGLKGTFIDYRGKKYVQLRIEAINQSLLVYVPPAWVKKL